MIFHEIYSVYYQTVAKILEEALDHPLKQDEICNIIEKYAFSESILSIESALREQKWQLLKSDGTTIFKNDPSMPLTTIQKHGTVPASLIRSQVRTRRGCLSGSPPESFPHSAVL